MKVAELEGALLDYWVAKAEGYPLSCDWDQGDYILIGTGAGDLERFSPSTDWDEGGEIIEREGIGVWKGYDSESRGKVTVWEAADGSPVHAIEISGPMGKGPTPLIAAMRAYVRLKFGKEVDDAPHNAG